MAIDTKTISVIIQIAVGLIVLGTFIYNIGVNVKSRKENSEKISQFKKESHEELHKIKSANKKNLDTVFNKINKNEHRSKQYLFKPDGEAIYVRANDFKDFQAHVHEFQKDSLKFQQQTTNTLSTMELHIVQLVELMKTK